MDALVFGNSRRAGHFVLLLASMLFICRAPVALAQSFDASHLREPTDLGMPWLMHGGDDPAFARADFDDAQWAVFDPHRNLKNVLKGERPAVVWYRLHLKVDPKQTGLALREFEVSRAFEVYVNGERVMECGRVTPYVPYTMAARQLAVIPERLIASGSLVIALRVYISAAEWGNTGNPGYYATNLTIGQRDVFTAEDWLAVIGEHSMTWLDHLLVIALGMVALVLFAAQRRQTEYLWIAALGLLTLIESIEPFLAAFYTFPLHWEAISDSLRVATPYIWVSLYLSFVHQRIGWRWRAFLVVTGLLNAFAGIQGLYLILPVLVQFFCNILFVTLISVVVPLTLAIHWRRGNREAGILLFPTVLFSLYIYAEIGFQILFQFPGKEKLALNGLDLIDRFPAGPFSISLASISSILSTLALAMIMLLRSTTMSRRQAILEGELAAAQQVQQVLVPEQIEAVPGFDVESVYEPAQQVGGDFFQVLPAGKGGLLVVVGDVAGKGLPAAMMVSVLVGALRGVAEYTVAPAELLASLNERLIGRSNGGFSTALAAHITADGWVTIGNAGHLSPYLDGNEVQLAGALPLGVLSGSAYETSQFYLAHGSRLTFYSDGVVEAQNRQGELFGFERAKAISTESAAAIADAAKQFGQEDDITVVTIDRHFALATAA